MVEDPTVPCVATPLVPTPSYTCPVSGVTVNISNMICTDVGVYILVCKKDSGLCRQVCPTYVGECGDGPNSSFTHRLGKHLGTTTNTSQSQTETPVGRHFRLSGHNPSSDLVLLPIEKISDPFIRKARESYYIKKFCSLKKRDISDIEHGLNLSTGQS